MISIQYVKYTVQRNGFVKSILLLRSLPTIRKRSNIICIISNISQIICCNLSIFLIFSVMISDAVQKLCIFNFCFVFQKIISTCAMVSTIAASIYDFSNIMQQTSNNQLYLSICKHLLSPFFYLPDISHSKRRFYSHS